MYESTCVSIEAVASLQPVTALCLCSTASAGSKPLKYTGSSGCAIRYGLGIFHCDLPSNFWHFVLLLPETPSRAQLEGVTTVPAPRKGVPASPRPAPGRRRRRGARAAPGNRPSSREGSPGATEKQSPPAAFPGPSRLWDLEKKREEREKQTNKIKATRD